MTTAFAIRERAPGAVLESRSDGAPSAEASADVSSAGRALYLIHGLWIESDIPLPMAPSSTASLKDGGGEAPARPPDVVYRRATPGEVPPPADGVVVASTPCPVHGFHMRVHRGPGGAWIWHREIATCHVHPGARTVVVYPEDGADESVLGLLLAGQVSVFVLHQLGIPTLHASAAVTRHGAAAFLGPKGQGKSTMVAAFLHRGATLLTDDVLPLRVEQNGAFGFPSLPIMKVWPETAEGALELAEELPHLVANYEKRLLRLEGRFSFATAPARVRAFYFLDRYDPAARGRTDIISRRLAGRESIAVIRSQASPGALLNVTEEARLLPWYVKLLGHAPVHVLSFPNGFASQSAVHDHIMAELAALTGAQAA